MSKEGRSRLLNGGMRAVKEAGLSYSTFCTLVEHRPAARSAERVSARAMRTRLRAHRKKHRELATDEEVYRHYLANVTPRETRSDRGAHKPVVKRSTTKRKRARSPSSPSRSSSTSSSSSSASSSRPNYSTSHTNSPSTSYASPLPSSSSSSSSSLIEAVPPLPSYLTPAAPIPHPSPHSNCSATFILLRLHRAYVSGRLPQQPSPRLQRGLLQFPRSPPLRPPLGLHSLACLYHKQAPPPFSSPFTFAASSDGDVPSSMIPHSPLPPERARRRSPSLPSGSPPLSATSTPTFSSILSPEFGLLAPSPPEPATVSSPSFYFNRSARVLDMSAVEHIQQSASSP